jgi:predicted TIM-barrel fold metal-dependent hydrolase
MGRISECQNIFVKISGLGVAGQAWTVEAQKPIVQTLIDQFGVDRCMFASNYPVDALVTNLDSIWSGFKQLTKRLNPTERLAIFCDTAVNVYQLK